MTLPNLRTTLIVIVASVGGLSMLFASSSTLAGPYSTPAGQGVLAVVAGIYAAGLWWMRRLAVLSTGTRFLRTTRPAPAEQGPGR